MYKKGLFVLVLVLLSLAFTSFVSASQSVVVSEVNENLTAVYVQNPLNFYSYEVNFNIDLGESYHVDFANVFGGGTTRGSALDGDSILSVYESKLGDAGAGFGDGTGTYNLFNVTHYGGLSLYDSLLVGNNKSEDRPAYCGNGLIETGEQCDGSNMTSCVARGYGGGVLTCNSDCTANTSKCTGIYTPPADTTGGRGGSGGAALGNLVNVSDVKLEVNPSELNINVVSGQESRRSISIKNIGSNKVTLDLVLAGLNAESGFDSNNLTLEPGEKKSINFVLRDLQKGLYVGQVLVRYNGQTVKSVLLTINTKSANFLFNISV